MSKRKTLTLDDIAAYFGISKTTVSRALSGKGRISSARKAEIISYAIDAGYPVKSRSASKLTADWRPSLHLPFKSQVPHGKQQVYPGFFQNLSACHTGPYDIYDPGVPSGASRSFLLPIWINHLYYRSGIPCASQAARISEGQRLAWTSPM